MIQNYLKIASRNLLKHKFNTLVNILGLMVGIASSLLIGWYVLDELSYDDFHQEAEQVFRITTFGGEYYHLATTPPPLYEAIKTNIPEVEHLARVFTWNHSTMRLPLEEDESQEVVFRETRVFIADPEFLQVLDFNIIAGDATNALRTPNALVLSKATAERYFGEGAVERGEVLGKEILFGGSREARQVSAVVDPPQSTHFHFDMLVAPTGYSEITDTDNWSWNIMHTYIKVRAEVLQGDGLAQLSKKLDQIAKQYAMPYLKSGESGPSESTELRYELQPVQDIHLTSDLLREHEANASIETVYVLTIVAVLIVLLACINFMNLSTAQAIKRAKEVGVRKVLGSRRTQLIIQFLLESVLLSFFAMLLALGVVEALRLPFNELVGKNLAFDWWSHWDMLLILVGGMLVVGLLSGSYPAFFLSGFRPASVLKGKMSTLSKNSLLRNTLIVFQFVVSIGLIISTALVVQQLHFIQTKDLGYERENVLIIKNDKEIQGEWKAFKASLLQLSQVKEVSFATGVPSQSLATVAMRDFRQEGADNGQGMQWFLVDPDYISTMGMEVIAGRNFKEELSSDQQQGLLLNEAAVKALGLEEPVGKTIIKNLGKNDEQKLEVIGIVKDFHVETFDRQVKPIAIQYFTPSFLSDYVVVRTQAENTTESVSAVESVWSRFEPENPFVYSFLDQDFDHMFRAEQRLGDVLKVFTFLAILVACLGLFGLVAFVTSQRTKEIGVRKVLGATVLQINNLLALDFLRLVLLAFSLAAPLAYLAIERWLNNFAYRTEISWSIFLVAGLAAVIIAWLTISVQSVRAALANPVNSLRDE
ncbi:ABC transporter permease [Porifericola rhodea]|uniref:ABC transporter permease n=1 Tax=Porifericola rhodea TaxID=930972 RepID=UPI002665D51E|nr:ABC transporter permease [Porifericola rhodea]WKN32640.1 ABC transporter permease [Porifericola rhodea]